MYRVLLVNPPRHHLVHLDTPDNVDLGEMSSFPPIGLMYLAEALRRGMEGVEVRIVDAVVDDLDAEAVVARVRDFATDMVGMTTFTYTFYDAWTTARAIKRAFPEMPVAVGGPHMYLFPTETLRHDCFDYGVVGDGETAFPALCEALRRGKEFPEDVPGLVAWRRDGLIGQPAPAEISDPDEIGVPAIDLIDVRRYFSPIGKSDAVGTICTSRGCPFRCTFCQVPHRRYRMRSVGSVVDEIEQYVSRDVRDFFFFDDLFNITTTRVIDFCDELDRRGLRVSWMFRGRADQVSDEMARRARAAGCHTISLGVEAATDAGLREIRKKLTMEQAFRAVRTIRKAGIAVLDQLDRGPAASADARRPRAPSEDRHPHGRHPRAVQRPAVHARQRTLRTGRDRGRHRRRRVGRAMSAIPSPNFTRPSGKSTSPRRSCSTSIRKPFGATTCVRA